MWGSNYAAVQTVVQKSWLKGKNQSNLFDGCRLQMKGILDALGIASGLGDGFRASAIQAQMLLRACVDGCCFIRWAGRALKAEPEAGTYSMPGIGTSRTVSCDPSIHPRVAYYYGRMVHVSPALRRV
eukprot:6174480-Pleurochrysis_carterae.AAC.3